LAVGERVGQRARGAGNQDIGPEDIGGGDELYSPGQERIR